MNFASYDFWQTLFFCFVASRLAIGLAGKCCPSREQDIGKLCLLATGLILLGVESLLTLTVFLWVVALNWIGMVLAGRSFFSKRVHFVGELAWERGVSDDSGHLFDSQLQLSATRSHLQSSGLQRSLGPNRDLPTRANRLHFLSLVSSPLNR